MSITTLLLIFLGLAVLVALAGTQLTRTADRIAAKTDWGEAMVGLYFM